MLRNLSSAPLKPPQRMQILKVHLLPKLDHRLALSAINKGLLRRLDRLVRREVIRWLQWLFSDSHWWQRLRERTNDQTVVENNSDQNVPVAANGENVRETRRKGDDSTI